MNDLIGFPAPAKLNLMLRVIGRRADGYHLLQTVFRFIDYGDVVHVRVRDDGVIARVRPLPGVTEAEDLTLRAARALQVATGTPLGADIDAGQAPAARRRARRGQFGRRNHAAGAEPSVATRLVAQALAGPGARSSAPTCRCSCTGRRPWPRAWASILTPLAVPPAWYLVLVPPVAVSTAGIFSPPGIETGLGTD